jgi:hypothetical protein
MQMRRFPSVAVCRMSGGRKWRPQLDEQRDLKVNKHEDHTNAHDITLQTYHLDHFHASLKPASH